MNNNYREPSRSYPRPKVGAVRQPWALFQNAVGVPSCPRPTKCPNTRADWKSALRARGFFRDQEQQRAPQSEWPAVMRAVQTARHQPRLFEQASDLAHGINPVPPFANLSFAVAHERRLGLDAT